MFHAAIVEDEKSYSDTLLQYLEKYKADTGTEFSANLYTNGLDFLSEAGKGFDVVFLDISLPAMNGMDVARQLRERDPLVVLIFVTQMSQYAVKGYEVGALDYIVKPVVYSHFALKLDKAVRLLKEREAWYMLPVKDGIVRIQPSGIYYVESQEHYMVFFTAQGEYRTRMTMKSAERVLASHGFSRPNHSFLLNLNYVQAIHRNSVVLHGKEFSITRSYKKHFMDALTIHLGRRILHD